MYNNTMQYLLNNNNNKNTVHQYYYIPTIINLCCNGQRILYLKTLSTSSLTQRLVFLFIVFMNTFPHFTKDLNYIF